MTKEQKTQWILRGRSIDGTVYRTLNGWTTSIHNAERFVDGWATRHKLDQEAKNKTLDADDIIGHLEVLEAPKASHLSPWISHVTIQYDSHPYPEYQGPTSIVLKYKDSVVVECSYMDMEYFPENCKLLGELDIEGKGLMIVPVEYIKGLHNDEEAESIHRCMDEDEKLLSYAR